MGGSVRKGAVHRTAYRILPAHCTARRRTGNTGLQRLRVGLSRGGRHCVRCENRPRRGGGHGLRNGLGRRLLGSCRVWCIRCGGRRGKCGLVCFADGRQHGRNLRNGDARRIKRAHDLTSDGVQRRLHFAPEERGMIQIILAQRIGVDRFAGTKKRRNTFQYQQICVH